MSDQTESGSPRECANVHEALAELVRLASEGLGKNSRAGSGGYSFMFRGIDAVYNFVHPKLAGLGLALLPVKVTYEKREERERDKTDRNGNKIGTVVEIFTCLRVKYRLHHRSGTSVKIEAAGEGMDAGDKSTSKAMSMAYKYGLFQALTLPTEETTLDPDAEVRGRDSSGAPAMSPKKNGKAAQPKKETPYELSRRRMTDIATTKYDSPDKMEEALKDFDAYMQANEQANAYSTVELNKLTAELDRGYAKLREWQENNNAA